MQRLFVPATLANLGSGFDALGVALNLYLQVDYRLADADRFVYEGEGEVAAKDNLVHAALHAAFTAVGEEPPPLEIHVYNPIPLARGMGSSAAARVAGAALADRLLEGRLGLEGIFSVASALEGHPDNVAPAVFGGFQVSTSEPLLHLQLATAGELRFVIAVPAFELPTEAARAALPPQVPFAVAVFNLSRAALWPAALAAGRFDLLLEAVRDRLHQPRRLELMPGAREALAAAGAMGVPAFVAGAGPSLAAVVTGDPKPAQEAFAGYVGDTGRTYTLSLGGGVQWKAT